MRNSINFENSRIHLSSKSFFSWNQDLLCYSKTSLLPTAILFLLLQYIEAPSTRYVANTTFDVCIILASTFFPDTMPKLTLTKHDEDSKAKHYIQFIIWGEFICVFHSLVHIGVWRWGINCLGIMC